MPQPYHPSTEALTQSNSVEAFRDDAFNQLSKISSVHELKPGQVNTYDIDTTYPSGAVLNPGANVEQELHGVIRAGRELFGVVKALDVDPNTKESSGYVLTRFSTGEEGERATIIGPLKDNHSIEVGRSSLLRSRESDVDEAFLSGDHFTVRMSLGKLYVEDLHSTNGTEVLLPTDLPGGVPAKAATRGLGKLLRRRSNIPEPTTWLETNLDTWSADPHQLRGYMTNNPKQKLVDTFRPIPEHTTTQIIGNTYHGRQVIERGTRVEGGVYIQVDSEGNPTSEAITVDTEHYAIYDKLTDEVRELSKEYALKDPIPERAVLKAVFDVVDKVLPYSQARTDLVMQKAAGMAKFEPGREIDLSAFVQIEGGVCRHQALLATLLTQRLRDASPDTLPGEISFETNAAWAPDGDAAGHAWLRYTDKVIGLTYILDTAQHFLGTLDEAVRKGNWNYLQPEDYQQ